MPTMTNWQQNTRSVASGATRRIILPLPDAIDDCSLADANAR